MRFFFLSYLLIDKNIVVLFGGIISADVSNGWSKALKFGIGYKTFGFTFDKDLKVSLNIPAGKKTSKELVYVYHTVHYTHGDFDTITLTGTLYLDS